MYVLPLLIIIILVALLLPVFGRIGRGVLKTLFWILLACAVLALIR
jgi:hypothetical protein